MLPGQHLRILDICPKSLAGWRCTCADLITVWRMLTWSNLYCTLIPWVCAWDVSDSEAAVPMDMPVSRRNTPFLCCLSKCPFPTYLGRSKFYKPKGLCAGYCMYHWLYVSMHIWSQPGTIWPTDFWVVGFVIFMSQASKVCPTGIRWYSARGEHAPHRDTLWIGRCNDLDEIMNYPSSKFCPDLVTYSICRSYCLYKSALQQQCKQIKQSFDTLLSKVCS